MFWDTPFPVFTTLSAAGWLSGSRGETWVLLFQGLSRPEVLGALIPTSPAVIGEVVQHALGTNAV